MGPADYQRVMRARPVAKSAHFNVYFLAWQADLSTGEPSKAANVVDDKQTQPDLWRLGMILPKKMARRSVTRSLMKHQARELWRQCASGLGLVDGRFLPAGDWVLRLKAPWPLTDFPSAASDALKQAVRDEMLVLLEQGCLFLARALERPQ